MRLLCLLLFTSLSIASCARAPEVPAQHQDGRDHATDHEQPDQGTRNPGSVRYLHPQVVHVYPHDRSSFTQGLEFSKDTLYEGTGLRGASVLRALEPETGRVLREARLGPEFFGEGITVAGERIWQLTWQEETAILRDRSSFAEIARVPYSGEGWGLCFDGSRLLASDGSSTLTFRDPGSFAVAGKLAVTRDGEPVEGLNELECTPGAVWANVWGSDEILRIDPATGQVTDVVDARGLLPTHERAGTDVLNGIAAVPGTEEFVLTGKFWPHMYRVKFLPK